jgi:tRNA(Arg) A34 adenosine deaminase TadA
MCCGTIIVNRVSTLVVGGQSPPGQGYMGDYTMEKLLAMTGWDKTGRLVKGVLYDECMALMREWDVKQGRVSSGPGLAR